MSIKIQKAGEHNLKDIDVTFREGLTVVTGVSGSGKTSLVFDTLYHEARRRFLEINTFGQALRLTPARVQSITGLGPAVAVGQNVLNRNPASTLATASGLHPFLRLLYANYATRQCPNCGTRLQVTGLGTVSEDELVERVLSLAGQGGIRLYAPLVRRLPGSQRTLLASLAEEFSLEALIVDGKAWDQRPLDPLVRHTIEVELAYLEQGATAGDARQAVLSAAALGCHALLARSKDDETLLSFAPVCVECGRWFGELKPTHFHTPCPYCSGQGCPDCEFTGLYPEALAARWQGFRLPDLLAQPVEELGELFAGDFLPPSAARLRAEIIRRLDALLSVGLGYLSLDRPSPTLSRGEAQRVRLAVVLTSQLEDMLHVLDEPTIGQHPADVAATLPAFRAMNGPVIYVEHDRMAAAVADQAIDLGPGAGGEGGRVVFSGSPAGLWRTDTASGRYFSFRERTPTPEKRRQPEEFLTVRGAHLRNLQDIDVLIAFGRLNVISGVSGSGKSTFVEDVLVASISAGRPVGCRGIELGPKDRPGESTSLAQTGLKAALVDQSPIGMNPRSNPATYTGLAGLVREVFGACSELTPSHFSFNRPEGACPTCDGMGAVEIKMRYLPSTWIPCTDCNGQRFSQEVLAVRVPFGARELNIAEFFELPVLEAKAVLEEAGGLTPAGRRKAERILEALCDVGLGYLTLGQPSPTLSGGEAQRVKLASVLGKRSLAGQLLVLDEPSTGLHPQDLGGLLVVLDRLARQGATIVVVEHNTDVIRAADWVVDLGPGSGPRGGRVLYAGPMEGLARTPDSLTGKALQEEERIAPQAGMQESEVSRNSVIAIRGARANNLRGIDVDFPKGALTVVTGPSGSGKSSLVGDVLEAEARRRFLESLSMYERQSTQEGPEAPVDSIVGLGVTLSVGPERSRFHRRATVGTASELSHHLGVLMANHGERACPNCLAEMQRGAVWNCPVCGIQLPLAQPRHFSSSTYAAACRTCHGVGTLQVPRPGKLIVHPEKPICDGAMHSPGFFPKGYLCKPYNGGYDMVQALAARYGFDPITTPWKEMSPEAQQAFLFGDPEPMAITYHSRNGRVRVNQQAFPGFYGFIRDWDVGGTYTDTEVCADCQGAGLRLEYLLFTLAGYNIHQLSMMPLSNLAATLAGFRAGLSEEAEPEEANVSMPGGIAPTRRSGASSQEELASYSLSIAERRLEFLQQVGLGYLQLNRLAATLSAGEAQRVKLAGLLGSGLTSLTVLLDEPTRGLHPGEVGALCQALVQLRAEGNTVIVIEHDPMVMLAADWLIDMGPGAGASGGRIIAQGSPKDIIQSGTLTAQWLGGKRGMESFPHTRQEPQGWLTIRGARANNLSGENVRLPLGVLTGVCGVSGSGKSTLIVDTLGRALAPRKHTTSVAHEPLAPGEHEAIEGALERTVVVDQARAGLTNPAGFLDLDRPLRALFAASEDAHSLGLDEKDLARSCSVCNGNGILKTDMGFLPDVYTPCDTCRGSGYRPEAWEVRLKGLALPELDRLTIEEVYALFGEEETLARPMEAARQVGLGYLALRQPGYTLSGGEAQRLKIAKELSRKLYGGMLYLLDEPTVGQHLEDVARLAGVLHGLVHAGNSVIVVEHHPHLLASCDWLVELGPGGGPEGGRVIATGTPEVLAVGATPIAQYLKDVLEAWKE